MKRIGVIGLGAMGTSHVRVLGKIAGWQLTAVCDSNANRENELRLAGDIAPTTAFFTDCRQLMRSGLCDCVAIVTPHPSHPEIVADAFACGLHVMCDKPIAVAVSAADRMIECWQKSGRLFSTMYSLRCRPSCKLVREWISSGKLGAIIRVEMTCTQWLRTQAYFDAQQWRATWNGEGGGLLMNQAPHNLDLLYWWFGPASRISAKAKTRFHHIETEDEVFAVIETAKGFPINFYSSTGEAPGKDYLEIVGSKGTLVKNGEDVYFKRLHGDLEEIIVRSRERMPTIECTLEPLEIPAAGNGHQIIFENILDCLENGAELIAPGQEGIYSVEMANAMLLSNFTGAQVDLPLDRAAYDALLDDLKHGRRKIATK